VNGASPWDTQARRPKTGPLAAAMTGPMLAVKGAAALVTPKQDEPLRNKVLRIISVSVIVVAAFAAGAYLLTNSGGGTPNPNSLGASPALNQPTTGGTTAASKAPTTKATAKAKSTAKAKTSGKKTGAAATAAYVLSTPATAGGYPMGTDPHFIATATTTARSIMSKVTSGGGGTVQGNPVSAPYRLPTGEQVITFVGYKGTFTPAKVLASMGSYGSTDGKYTDTKTHDSIACANTPATAAAPSGAVCVWATASTLGITEFFDVSGPEVLTVSQARGAADTEKLRASVETKKS
jgi:hypothetical protein